MSTRLRGAATMIALVLSWLGVDIRNIYALPALKLATTAGLMQQPTSHYYCAVYGVVVDFGTENESFLTRASYVERPEFRSNGFVDKEYGWFAQIGSKLTKAKSHGLYAYIGAGRMRGYMKLDKDFDRPQASSSSTATSINVSKRSFTLPGATATLEYAARLGSTTLAASHQTFIGYVDDQQLEAKVAWPYNFFQLTLGYAL